MKKILLIITPIKHIEGLYDLLKKNFNIIYIPDFNYKNISKKLSKINYIYTNPNKSNIFIDIDFVSNFPNLKAICTASTGTNHIDKKKITKRGIKIISLTKEYKIIKQISSTSELAVTLSMMAARNVVSASFDVYNKNWDYEKFIGRQFNGLKIGVLGYGRLGKIYSNIMLSLGAQIYVYDPYKKVRKKNIIHIKKLNDFFKISDIISIHVHDTNETNQMINANVLKHANKNLIIINTSRGEIINESQICKFLSKNKNSKVYVDVLADEINDKFNSCLYKYFKNQETSQVFITPHIGGMTKEAQIIAYTHAAKLLIDCKNQKI